MAQLRRENDVKLFVSCFEVVRYNLWEDKFQNKWKKSGEIVFFGAILWLYCETCLFSYLAGHKTTNLPTLPRSQVAPMDSIDKLCCKAKSESHL